MHYSDYEYKFANEECWARMQSHYDILNEAEKRIADYYLSNKDKDYKNISVQKLAIETKTSPATVVRFCKALGFKGYPEFKYYLEKRILTLYGANYTINSNDDVRTLKQKSLKYATEMMDETLSLADDTELQRAIDSIDSARRIIIVGEGTSGGVAHALSIILLNMGFPVVMNFDPYANVMAVANAAAGDVVFGIANNGNNRDVTEALMIGQFHGATTICITGKVKAPLMQYADIKIAISNKPVSSVYDFPSITICQMQIVSILQAGLLLKSYSVISNRIKKSRQAVQTKIVGGGFFTDDESN